MIPLGNTENILIRSALLVAGNRSKEMDQAVASNADAIIFDLEGFLSGSIIEDTRRIISNKLTQYSNCRKALFVKINRIETGLVSEDIMSLPLSSLQGIILPKTEQPDHIHHLNELLLVAEKFNGLNAGRTKIIALIETALGIEYAFKIASCQTKPPRLWTFVLGAAVLAADVGFDLTKTGEELDFSRSKLVFACRAAGLDSPLDTPYMFDSNDTVALKDDIIRARNHGFLGKLCIHPNQVDLCNQLFSPSPKELKQARRIAEAIKSGQEYENGIIQLDGKLIYPPMIKRALKLINFCRMKSVAQLGI